MDLLSKISVVKTNKIIKQFYGNSDKIIIIHKLDKIPSLQYEFLKLNELKFNYKKEHLLKEINELIDNFDSELCDLKSERCNISFYQKLGEYELILRHKELNKLRAFDKEDKKFCDRLIKMYEEYKANLDNLKRNFEYMEQNKKGEL